MEKCWFERERLCSERRSCNSMYFVWPPFHFASSLSCISSFGSRKCRFVETSRLGHKRARKGNRSAFEMWACEKKQRVEMCHSVCMRKPFIQPSVCAADCIRAGGDVSDLMVCCCGVLCMQLLLSACVSPLLLRGRLWFTAHDSFLSQASAPSISPGMQTLKLHITHISIFRWHTPCYSWT